MYAFIPQAHPCYHSPLGQAAWGKGATWSQLSLHVCPKVNDILVPFRLQVSGMSAISLKMCVRFAALLIIGANLC